MNWRTGIGVVLLVVAVFSGWSLLRDRNRGPQAVVDDGSVDYVLHDFDIVVLDEDGRESTTLRAPRLERARADQTLSIVTPVFEMPDKDGNHWTLRSRTGWVSAKGDEMRLRGDVSGDSPSTGATPPTTFRTTHLTVLPKARKASTDALVTMTRPGMQQSGVGFELDSENNTYHFLSQARGRYTPRR